MKKKPKFSYKHENDVRVERDLKSSKFEKNFCEKKRLEINVQLRVHQNMV